MSDSRLSDLAVLSIERDILVDYEETVTISGVARIFSALGHFPAEVF